MNNYKSIQLRLNKYTVEDLETIKNSFAGDKNDLFNYLVVNTGYNDLIQFLARYYMDHALYNTGEELG